MKQNKNKMKKTSNNTSNNVENNPPIACTICLQQFGTTNALRLHRQKKHRDVIEKKAAEKKFACDVCGTTFKENRYLKDHIKRGFCNGVPQRPIAIEGAVGQGAEIDLNSNSSVAGTILETNSNSIAANSTPQKKNASTTLFVTPCMGLNKHNKHINSKRVQVKATVGEQDCSGHHIIQPVVTTQNDSNEDISVSDTKTNEKQEQRMLQDETGSLIKSMRKFGSAITTATLLTTATKASTGETKHIRKMLDDRSFGLTAKSAIYNRRAQRLIFNDLTQQEIEIDTTNEKLQAAIDNVAQFLEYVAEHPTHPSPEEAGIFLEWITQMSTMLEQYRFVTCPTPLRLAFTKEIFRVNSIINTQRERTDASISSVGGLDQAILQLDLFNTAKIKQIDPDIGQPQQWKSRFEIEQHKWADYLAEFKFSNYFPRWYIYKIREALYLSRYEGEEPPSIQVHSRLQQVLSNNRLYARVWTSVNGLPAIVSLINNREEEKKESIRTTPRTVTTRGADLDVETEKEVFEIIHKRIHFIHRNYDGKDNKVLSPAIIQVDQLPIYKIHRSIFQHGPPAMFTGCAAGRVQEGFDRFFSLLIDIKINAAKFTDRAEKLLCRNERGIRATASQLLEICRLINGDLNRQLVEKWKGQFLNYVFMGCLPEGVEKARLYFGSVLSLPLLDLQKHFTEKEMLFTCKSSTGKRIQQKADDATDKAGERRKRTLKMQMKTREQQSIADDATKLKPMKGFLQELLGLKRLNQHILGHLEKILDHVEQSEKLFLMKPGNRHHAPLAILEQWAFELQQRLHQECKIENERLKLKRSEENLHVSRVIGMHRTTHTKRQKKVRSLAIALEQPMTTLQLLEYVEKQVRIDLDNKFTPLIEIFRYHDDHRATTTIKFIACSQQGLIKHSSNELIRKETERKWTWLSAQEIRVGSSLLPRRPLVLMEHALRCLHLPAKRCAFGLQCSWSTPQGASDGSCAGASSTQAQSFTDQARQAGGLRVPGTWGTHLAREACLPCRGTLRPTRWVPPSSLGSARTCAAEVGLHAGTQTLPVLSVEANLVAQWQEMLTKKCLIVQVGSSSDPTVVFDELVVDLHPAFQDAVVGGLGQV